MATQESRVRAFAEATADLLVVGAGPAGLALAAETAALGLSVILVSAEPELHLRNSYGAFLSNLEGLHLEDAFLGGPRQPSIRRPDGSEEQLSLAYVRFSRSGLTRLLAERLQRSGAKVVVGTATALSGDDTERAVSLSDGRVLRARLVVDTTGGASTWTARTRPQPAAYQTALGLWCRLERPILADGELRLMDYETRSGEAPETFLYATPNDEDGLFFAQETVLASRTRADFPELEKKLLARLVREGAGRIELVRRERCSIPLGVPLPKNNDACLSFGAAASYTHPASGYQLTHTLRRAPEVARAISDSFELPEKRRSGFLRDAVWPKEALRARQLYDFGLETLLEMTPSRRAAFLTTFLCAGGSDAAAYLEGVATPKTVRTLMWTALLNASMPLQAHLLQSGVRQSAARIARWLAAS